MQLSHAVAAVAYTTIAVVGLGLGVLFGAALERLAAFI
jgi:hypothetical protein